MAHPDEIRGTSDTAAKNNKLQSPTIRSSINITIDKYLSEEEIEATKRYIKWIDVNVDEVFEMASNLVDFDKIQKDLDAALVKETDDMREVAATAMGRDVNRRLLEIIKESGANLHEGAAGVKMHYDIARKAYMEGLTAGLNKD